MCAKNQLLIFSSFLDIWENVEWPRFFWTTRYIIRTNAALLFTDTRSSIRGFDWYRNQRPWLTFVFCCTKSASFRASLRQFQAEGWSAVSAAEVKPVFMLSRQNDCMQHRTVSLRQHGFHSLLSCVLLCCCECNAFYCLLCMRLNFFSFFF